MTDKPLVTPQRMRMIVHAIEETLDAGLQRDGMVVVSHTNQLPVLVADGVYLAHE